MKRQTYTVNIYSPGGNVTALVTPFVTKKTLKKQINDRIMRSYPTVEQVGFVRVKNNVYQLEMAGGEFCGNAVRTAAYFFLDGKKGSITLQTSGTGKKLFAGIDRNNEAYTSMPIRENPNTITTFGPYTIVPLEGITQVVVNKYLNGTNAEALKREGYTILRKLNLLRTLPASGVIFTTTYQNQITITPIVWVRDIQTLFRETACASGSTAVALAKTKQVKKSLTLPIIQPSRACLTVTTTYTRNQFENAVISGPIKFLLKESFSL